MDAKDAEIVALRERAERLTATLGKLADLYGQLLREAHATPKVADATPDVAAPQPATPGLRWGVRHKATGGIVARFRCGDTACGYINLGYSVGRWHSDDLELVDLAHAPVEPPAQPPTSAKSH